MIGSGTACIAASSSLRLLRSGVLGLTDSARPSSAHTWCSGQRRGARNLALLARVREGRIWHCLHIYKHISQQAVVALHAALHSLVVQSQHGCAGWAAGK